MPIARWNCCSWRCQCVTRTSSLEKLWYQCTKTPRSHRKKIPTLEILIQRNRIKKSPETTFSSQSAPCLKPISAGPCGGWCPEKNRPETGTFNRPPFPKQNKGNTRVLPWVLRAYNLNIPHYKGHYMTTNPNFMPFFLGKSFKNHHTFGLFDPPR